MKSGDHYGDRGTFHDSCTRSIANAGPGPEPPPRDDQAIVSRLEALDRDDDDHWSALLGVPQPKEKDDGNVR